MSSRIVFTKVKRSAFFIALLLSFFAFHISTTYAATWYSDQGAKYRTPITLHAAMVGNGTEDETNFPVLISLSGFPHVNADGSDVRFTAADGTTLLPRDIEISSTGLFAWVKIPTLSHTTDTTIYMYSGDPHATDLATTSPYGAGNVWTNSYEGVYHFAQTSDGSLSALDSTNGNVAIKSGSMATTTGEVGTAASFDGSSSIVRNDIDGNLAGTSAFTIGSWINFAASTRQFLVMRSTSNNHPNYYFWYDGSEFVLGFYSQSTNYKDHYFTYTPTLGAWTYASMVYGNGTIGLYLNGVSVFSEAETEVPYNQDDQNFLLGQSPSGDRFHGALDQVSISSSKRSAGWINTEYLNQSAPASFYAVGTQTAGTFVLGLTPSTTGTSVAIAGSGLSGVTGVLFGSTPAPSFTINSDTSITATVPAGTGTVDVRVTTSTGTSPISAVDKFTYVAASPTVFTPQSSEPVGVAGLNSTAFSRLPYFKPSGTDYYGSSSYSRGGDNSDSGPVLYQDSNNDYVLADVAGPGEIDHIWFTNVDPTSQYVKIYFDGSTTPTINMKLSDLLSGAHAPFVTPLVGYSNSTNTDDGMNQSGYFIDLPMAFAQSAKVVVTSAPTYWNVDYRTFKEGTGVTTFTPTTSSPNYVNPSVAATLWNSAMADPKPTTANITNTGTVTVPANSTATILDTTGGGSINTLKFSVAQGGDTDAMLKNLWIKMYWDNQLTPSVSAPFNLFFATSQAGNTHTLPVGKDTDGNYYVYFPMPYSSHARIVIENKNATTTDLTYSAQYATGRYVGLGNTAGYFSAHYNDTTLSPLVSGQNYSILNLASTKGQFLGVTYSTDSGQNLEGNMEFRADGDLSPDLEGTGTEDYFGGAYFWLDGSFTQATHGVILIPNSAAVSGTTILAYRFNLNNPVSFSDSVKIGIQHGPTNDSNTDPISTVAYYYAAPSPSTSFSTITDTLNVGNSSSQTAHAYTSTGATPVTDSAYYYAAAGHLGSQLSDDGEEITGESSFTVSIDPANKGVKLRRRFNYYKLNQKAQVYIDGTLAGTWYDPGNSAGTTLSWRDSNFEIPSSLTSGKSSITVRIVYDATGGTAWTQHRFWVYSYVDVNSTAPTTTPTPTSATYSSPQTVSLSCSDSSGSGCYQTFYTVDGTTPSTASPAYASPLSVTQTTTVKYFSENFFGNIEPVSTAVYTISAPAPVSAPSQPYVGGGGGGGAGPSYLNGFPGVSTLVPGTTSTVTTTSTNTTSSNTSSGSVSTSLFTRDLTLGSTGNDVMQLQMFLNAHGFIVASNGAGSPGNETTYFGAATAAALAKFQAEHDITPAVGYFGAKTRASLSGSTSASVPVSTPSITQTPTSGTAPVFVGGDLQVGSVSADVRTLQQYLNAHGFKLANAGPGSPGKETTTFGYATQYQLKKFQIANDITPATGYFGAKTKADIQAH